MYIYIMKKNIKKIYRVKFKLSFQILILIIILYYNNIINYSSRKYYYNF